MLPKNRKRALVLSGGGGRGAYHVGALRFLHEHEWFPDVVVGTSIGAVNGAALASGHSAQSLWALWRRLRTEHVQKPNLNPLKNHFLLDTAPLRETLMEDGWLDFGRINSAEARVHLRLTATEVDTGKLFVYGNSPDIFPSQTQIAPLTIDHIIASCSIPLIYPATKLDGHVFWDGATVSNTPLGAAIDAGAEDIVVVLMTPWGESQQTAVPLPENILQAASLALDWALLASFRADLKMFRRVNEYVKLKIQNARLQTMLAEVRQQIAQEGAAERYADLNQDGIPDVFEQDLRIIPDPVIFAPSQPIPAEQIVSYTLEGHERMYEMGYEDAKRAWSAAGRIVEGGQSS
ncbi:MAG: patatin-like phospholipase family protein [Chloroflexi bacterium]|nr:patatin-like phospholipase family protein [Chloroflexota bacterium]